MELQAWTGLHFWIDQVSYHPSTYHSTCLYCRLRLTQPSSLIIIIITITGLYDDLIVLYLTPELRETASDQSLSLQPQHSPQALL